MPATTEQPGRGYPRLSPPTLYLGFAATGTGMALPGAVLPALLSHWSESHNPIPDSQAGLLFFLAWIGSALGALLVRPPIPRSLAAGSLLLTASCLGIAQTNSPGAFLNKVLLFASMTLFGLGLGIVMTATSLLQSSRHPRRRGRELNRLNLVWSIGAALAPTLAAHSLRISNVQTLFLALASLFACLFFWTALFEPTASPLPNVSPPPLLPKTRPANPLSLWPIPILCVILLPTGIESALGAWIATYTQRAAHNLSATVSAGSCFWIGLMLSRALSSFLLSRQTAERIILWQSLVTVVLGILTLISFPATWEILIAVSLIGFGLGPIYPLLLAHALEYSENPTIFMVAGLGSAAIPWITGITSTHASSLQVGLTVPLAAAFLMLVLSVRILNSPKTRPAV